MIRRPPRSTHCISSAASDVYKRQKHGNKRVKAGRGTVGKVAVAGVRDRVTGKVIAAPVPSTNKETLQEFVKSTVVEDATIYTDDLKSYDGLPNRETVKHSVREYVRGHVHTNGIESFWSMFKRGHKGTYHKMSKKHLKRYDSMPLVWTWPRTYSRTLCFTVSRFGRPSYDLRSSV